MAKDEQKPMDTEARLAALEARNAQLMAALEAKTAPQAEASGMTREDFMLGLQTAMSAASKTSELIASKTKIESEHRHLGPFEHPLGGIDMPKPDFARPETFCFGARLRKEDLTYAEVLAVNDLHGSLARSQRRVCRDGKWIAEVSDDNNRLLISIPVKTIDDRQDLPAFIQIIQELTTAERAQDAGELAAELMLLKAQVAELASARA